MTGLITLLAAVLAASTPALQASRPAVVEQLMGEWRGQGTVLGRASSITMVWESAVGDAFVRLRFRNEMAAGATQAAAVLEAHGYYRFSGGPMNNRGSWIDSRGVVLPVVVTVADDALTSDWGDAQTEVGRTVYRLVAADTLEVVDSVRQADGSYRQFGRSLVTRRVSGDVHVSTLYRDAIYLRAVE
ncbi:MAG TPA: hypothetical protein VMM93_07760 [Vicinamibacterales bacterium]|nr:hypothetical protein [Vicinamibacterales bacterium]